MPLNKYEGFCEQPSRHEIRFHDHRHQCHNHHELHHVVFVALHTGNITQTHSSRTVYYLIVIQTVRLPGPILFSWNHSVHTEVISCSRRTVLPQHLHFFHPHHLLHNHHRHQSLVPAQPSFVVQNRNLLLPQARMMTKYAWLVPEVNSPLCQTTHY